MDYRYPQHIVRLLISEEAEWFRDLIAILVHDLARTDITLVMTAPNGIREEDLLKQAIEIKFDLAVLFLNNILYSSGNREAQALADDSVRLVRTIVSSLKKPVIAFYGWPDLPDYKTRILQAGATAAFRVPCNDVEEIQRAVKRCLPIW
jgi:hypothetical protein